MIRVGAYFTYLGEWINEEDETICIGHNCKNEYKVRYYDLRTKSGWLYNAISPNEIHVQKYYPYEIKCPTNIPKCDCGFELGMEMCKTHNIEFMYYKDEAYCPKCEGG